MKRFAISPNTYSKKVLFQHWNILLCLLMCFMVFASQPIFASQNPEQFLEQSQAQDNEPEVHDNENSELATETSPYRFEVLTTDLSFPWSLVFLTDNTMLITERSGTVRHVDSEGFEISHITPPLHDLWVSGQAGLFDIALSPQFSRNKAVFLSYACGTANANNTCLARLTWNGETLEDSQVIFRAAPAKRGSAHYGGRIAFMPDNTLLLTLGDGFDYREDAQRVANHLGSVVRIEQDGSIPADNPMLASSTAKPEIFTYGHRNVQGIAWHPEQRRMFISEHGPRGGDEINRLRSGANYGWPLITEGVDYTGALISPYKQLPGLTAAEFGWTPSIAPAGLTIYYGDMFNEWNGDLLVPALAGKHVARLRFRTRSETVLSLSEHAANLDNPSAHKPLQLEEKLFTELNQRIRDIRVHPQTGALYLLTDSAAGTLIKVTASDK
ncbi:glucose/sorbosone dehydrogenase [Idiomarina sp. A28L]|uniref:PQQ-dependent sugar dehydrogenase n=1 Tax=Idiomarina sp. A28L TaxID=1036674 RepID=UPI00021389F2|nr:PQQ-dependent sugar dehydrogenase [Idiomarina sp. A28L]EGN76252.1 glucose/sorbosone dehydrogenase [Idiomarina sp. A28L]